MKHGRASGRNGVRGDVRFHWNSCGGGSRRRSKKGEKKQGIDGSGIRRCGIRWVAKGRNDARLGCCRCQTRSRIPRKGSNTRARAKGRRRIAVNSLEKAAVRLRIGETVEEGARARLVDSGQVEWREIARISWECRDFVYGETKLKIEWRIPEEWLPLCSANGSIHCAIRSACKGKTTVVWLRAEDR